MKSIIVGVITVVVGYVLLLQKGGELVTSRRVTKEYVLEKMEHGMMATCNQGCCNEQQYKLWFEERGKMHWVRSKSPDFTVVPEQGKPKLVLTYARQFYPDWWPEFLRLAVEETPGKLAHVEVRGSKEALAAHLYDKS